jgi:cell division protein FtsW
MSITQKLAAVSWGSRTETSRLGFDPWLVGAIVLLLALGLVMVSSASLHLSERQFGDPWHYTIRQLAFIGLGVGAMLVIGRVPFAFWERMSPTLLIVGIVMLALVLLPVLGREVNGAKRWLNLILFKLQVSELVKLFVIIYLAGYLVRRGDELRASVKGFAKPLALLGVISVLLLLEPDFGATTVIMLTALSMIFLAGVRLWQYGVLASLVAMILAALAFSSPYRVQRLTTFLDPWADPFASGFQLTQALIAIGRGEWFGVGLGAGVQKLFYLPEAHTDFVFSVLAEELGFIGSVLVIGLFVMLVFRAFAIARRAEQVGAHFVAYVVYGIALWIGLQAFINIGVNMGVLPTKGLTLPLMSYGGSSVIVSCAAVALLLRADRETRQMGRQAAREMMR